MLASPRGNEFLSLRRKSMKSQSCVDERVKQESAYRLERRYVVSWITGKKSGSQRGLSNQNATGEISSYACVRRQADRQSGFKD